jgi:hypothetical protein
VFIFIAILKLIFGIPIRVQSYGKFLYFCIFNAIKKTACFTKIKMEIDKQNFLVKIEDNNLFSELTGDTIINMHSKESGVGTRKSGEKIRNELINIYMQTNKSITLNFDKINLISSSFADELIGNLATEFGFYGFNNMFNLKNMNANVQSIVQRSVAQRMMESFSG